MTAADDDNDNINKNDNDDDNIDDNEDDDNGRPENGRHRQVDKDMAIMVSPHAGKRSANDNGGPRPPING